jgi:hypothetical protein
MTLIQNRDRRSVAGNRLLTIMGSDELHRRSPQAPDSTSGYGDISYRVNELTTWDVAQMMSPVMTSLKGKLVETYRDLR